MLADQRFLRFVDGCPISAVTIEFLTACGQALATRAVRVLVRIRDNTSWHKSQAVRTWMRSYTQTTKQPGDGSCASCLLQAPGLTPVRLNGSMASAPFPRRIASEALTNGRLGCAPLLVFCVHLISSCPNEGPESALAKSR